MSQGFVYRFQTTGTIEEKIFQRQSVIKLLIARRLLKSGLDVKSRIFPPVWSMKLKIRLVISLKMISGNYSSSTWRPLLTHTTHLNVNGVGMASSLSKLQPYFMVIQAREWLYRLKGFN